MHRLSVLALATLATHAVLAVAEEDAFDDGSRGGPSDALRAKVILISQKHFCMHVQALHG
jgi:hypothetical protein